MFKKILILAVIFSIVALGATVNAANAVSKSGISYLSQKGTESKLGYVVGFDFDILSDSAKTLIIGNETDFLYVEKRLEDIHELTIIRSFFMTTKILPANFYVKIGTGGWKIINSLGEDIDSFALRFGGGWKSPWGIKANLGLDIVRTAGADLYAPSLTITLLGI